jgi:hypothetical protein
MGGYRRPYRSRPGLLHHDRADRYLLVAEGKEARRAQAALRRLREDHERGPEARGQGDAESRLQGVGDIVGLGSDLGQQPALDHRGRGQLRELATAPVTQLSPGVHDGFLEQRLLSTAEHAQLQRRDRHQLDE